MAKDPLKNALGVVMEDDLVKIYHDFKSGNAVDNFTITRLLHYINGRPLISVKQYDRLGISIPSNLHHQLRQAGFNLNTPEEMANHKSSYKVVLTADEYKTQFPYVNILADRPNLENNFSASYSRSESRDFAIKHIAALCANAREVVVYDQYFSKSPDNVALLQSLLPKKNLKIILSTGHINAGDLATLHACCPDWTLEERPALPSLHDRYLVIDNNIEIILTSGFSSLAHPLNGKGDLTYIVRANSAPRFP